MMWLYSLSISISIIVFHLLICAWESPQTSAPCCTSPCYRRPPPRIPETPACVTSTASSPYTPGWRAVPAGRRRWTALWDTVCRVPGCGVCREDRTCLHWSGSVCRWRAPVGCRDWVELSIIRVDSNGLWECKTRLESKYHVFTNLTTSGQFMSKIFSSRQIQ